jgi:hypothetical protein
VLNDVVVASVGYVHYIVCFTKMHNRFEVS